MSMRKWIAESRALSPGLTALSLTMLGMIPVLSLALWLDHRMVTGVAVWVKPMKFTLSALSYSVFFLVMMPLMQPLSKRIRQMAEVMSWMLWLEIILIYAQAARGKASHFNMETMLDGLIFNAMAVGITTFVVLNIVIMVQFMRQKTGNPVMLTGIRWAFLIGITGMLVGYLMTQPTSTQVVELSKGLVPDRLGGHTVGAADGGAGLPFLNWSARFGDLRVAHFVGIHALQFLPLWAWWLVRWRPLQVSWARRRVHLVGGLYLGATLLLIWQAMRAESVAQFSFETMQAFAWLGMAGVATWLVLVILERYSVSRAEALRVTER